MPTYRYYTIPLLPAVGTQPVVELDLSSVTMDKTLDNPGNFSGTLRLGQRNDDIVLAGAVPGYHAIVCKRNDVPIWAGPIWSQSYESQGGTVQLTAQTYDSLWPWTPISSDFSWASTTNIVTIINNFQSLINTQLSGGTNYAWTQAIDAGSTSTGFFAHRFLAGEHKYESDFWDHVRYILLPGTTTVNITPATGDAITKAVYVGWMGNLVSLRSPAHSGIYLDYPGSVSAYWYPVNISGSGTRHLAVIQTGHYAIQNSDMSTLTGGFPTTGWPLLQYAKSYHDIIPDYASNATALAAYQATNQRSPNVSPTFELTDSSNFNGWNQVGTPFTVRVQDERYPAGRVLDAFLSGWSLTPEASDSPEVVRLSSWRPD